MAPIISIEELGKRLWAHPNKKYKKAYENFLKVRKENRKKLGELAIQVNQLEDEIEAARIKIKGGRLCERCHSEAMVNIRYDAVYDKTIKKCKVCGYSEIHDG